MTTERNNNIVRIIAILLSLFTVSIAFQACNDEPTSKLDNINDAVDLIVENDSQVTINRKGFKISELDSHLNQVRWKTSKNRTVSIKAEPSIKQMTVKQLERIVAKDSIETILYLLHGDTLEMTFISDPRPQFVFTIHSNGTLSFDDQKITDDRQVKAILNQSFGETKNPYFYVYTEKETGYGDYSQQKNRIERVLSQIDSTQEIHNGPQDFYEPKRKTAANE